VTAGKKKKISLAKGGGKKPNTEGSTLESEGKWVISSNYISIS